MLSPGGAQGPRAHVQASKRVWIKLLPSRHSLATCLHTRSFGVLLSTPTTACPGERVPASPSLFVLHVLQRGSLTTSVKATADRRLMHALYDVLTCTWGGHTFLLINVYLPSGRDAAAALVRSALLTASLDPLLASPPPTVVRSFSLVT